MELLMKNYWMLLTAILATMASCEPVDFSLPEPADQRFEQSRELIAEKSSREITVQSDDYSIVFMADSHAGTTNNLDSVFSIAMATGVSAVCIAGDLTSGDYKNYEVFAGSLPGDDEMPTFLTLGNHDLWSDEGWTEFYHWFGPSSYFFTVRTPGATDMYIALDSGSGTLGSKQLEWLEDILQNERSGCRRCIIFTHNDFLRVRHAEISNPLVEELTVLIDLFTRYHVDMLIAGHDHEPSEELFGITDYVITGAISDDDEDPDYMLLRVENGNLHNEFVNLY
jgi:predicted phosphodiesterase